MRQEMDLPERCPSVYFEQGTSLPREVAERLGVTTYLRERTDIQANRMLVMHRVRLRRERDSLFH